MADFWKSNKEKEEFIVNTWFKETFGNKNPQKSNYSRNKDLMESRSATAKEFYEYIQKKKQNKVSNYELVLSIEQDAAKIVSFANERIGDASNFEDEYTFKKNIAMLKNVPNNIKPVALFAGNLIGTEWTLASFRNFYNQKIGDENVRMFMGLQKRKQILKARIKSALDTGAEVVLMKGPQEYDCLNNKVTGVGIDILGEIANELNNPNLHYISEGTATNVNFIKKNVNRKNYYNTIEIETNISSNSAAPAYMSKYAKNYNGNSHADVVIRTNGNYTATEFHDNIIYPSGNLIYQNVAKKKNPAKMSNYGNTFLLYPEASNDVTIVLGEADKIYSQDNTLDNKIQFLKRQKEALAEIIKEKIDDKVKSRDWVK